MSKAPHSEAGGNLPIDAPLHADAQTAWALECDVLVVGYGAAGASAAIAAAEAGAQTLIVERFDGGGATAKSGGIVYAGGGTRQQRLAGYDDTAEAMYRYLRIECGLADGDGAVGDATLRRFCDDSTAMIEWLESIGVNFDSDPQYLRTQPKTSYPRDGIYLYYSGNEAVKEYAAVAAPAPRGHRVRGSFLSGRTLFETLRARVDALGVRTLRQSAVRRLVVNADGAVVGAELQRLRPDSPAAKRHARLMRRAEALHNVAPGWADRLRAQALAIESAEGERVLVRARGGVILSAGGFIFNRAMVAEHAAKFAMTMRLGATGCDGSGIRLGLSVGGAAARLDKVSAWRFINPPSVWPQGIVVDAQGQRFCNEQVYGAKLGVAMCEGHGGRAWLIVDKRLRRAAIREALFGRLWAFQSIPALILMLFAPRARSAAALAARIGMPGEALTRSLTDYNNGVRRGDDVLGKSPAFSAELTQPPYYALDVSAHSKTFPCPAITLGGLRVNEDSGAVRDDAGGDIAGLYAAGRTAIGIASNHYISGLSLADCLWSGRRAGRAAAQHRHHNEDREEQAA
ncbi:FAD-binding protein [Solimonas marina]|uniref:FAD-binding protein n=1 Tax=Solimonas marina TaxID=2714601 RepID=A0A970B808_9GAMM|nr:FAD-binding protein [Solimonas marina]NKF20946.1 FAD-binding protein [Solimonas marina]